MAIYDIVLDLLKRHPQLRDSDKKLMWSVWYRLGYAGDQTMNKLTFIESCVPTPESITRARRRVQEEHPELQATDRTVQFRRHKETKKGLFIFEEEK